MLLGLADHVHRIRAVRRGLHLEAGLRQDGFRNLPVQLIVLHQEDALAGEIGFCPGGGFVLLFDEMVGSQQGGLQVGHEQRLGAEGGDPCLLGLLLDVRPVVGGEDDDGDLAADGLADAPAGLQPAHLRHLPVDDIGMVGIPLIVGALRPIDRFLSGGGPLRPHADLGQHPAYALTAVAVVVHHDGPQPLQLLDLGRVPLGILELQAQLHLELAALPLLALDGDGAAHHLHDVLGDGHA